MSASLLRLAGWQAGEGKRRVQARAKVEQLVMGEYNSFGFNLITTSSNFLASRSLARHSPLYRS